MPNPTGPNPHNPKLPYFATEPFGLDFFRTARERHVVHATCACAPAALFEIFEDEASWTKWPIGITGVTWTSPRPLGKGATRTVRMAGGFEIYETFFVWEPGRELAFYITGETQPVWSRFGEHYLVEDLSGGRCRLTWTVAFDPRDTFARIQFLMRPLMARGFKLYMRRLEKLAAGWGK